MCQVIRRACSDKQVLNKLAVARKPFLGQWSSKQNVIFYRVKNYRLCAAATPIRIVQQKRRLKHLLVIMVVWKQSFQHLAIFEILQQKVQTFAFEETLISACPQWTNLSFPLSVDVFYGQPLTKFQ